MKFVSQRQWQWIILSLVLYAALNSIVEEVIFRYAVIKVLSAFTDSTFVVISISTLLFIAAHIVRFWEVPMPLGVLMTIIIVGAVAASLTIREGNVGSAIAIHVARNTAEFGDLFVSLHVFLNRSYL
jgi:membrane protease YdiL (CAAX protease family)